MVNILTLSNILTLLARFSRPVALCSKINEFFRIIELLQKCAAEECLRLKPFVLLPNGFKK